MINEEVSVTVVTLLRDAERVTPTSVGAVKKRKRKKGERERGIKRKCTVLQCTV